MDPFWSLVDLVQKNNSVEVLNNTLGVSPDCDGFEFNEEYEIEAAEIARLENMDEYSDSNISETSSNILQYNCPFCQKLYETKNDVVNHLDICYETTNENDINENFACLYCNDNFKSEELVLIHMNKHD